MVTIPYYPLGQEELAQIVRIKFGRIERLYRERYNATRTITDALVEEIARRCTDPDSGARNIDNILTHSVLPDLSIRLLEHLQEKRPVGTATVDVGPSGEFLFHISSEQVPLSM